MSSQRTESFYSRNPPQFGSVESAVVKRGLAGKAAERLRPFSANGARSIELAAEKTADPERHYGPTGVVKQQSQLGLQRRPYELLPSNHWDSSVHNGNPFQKNAVTRHMPHVAKSTTVRRVPLAHLKLAMEIDDTVGLPHHGTWAQRNEQRAASLGQVLMKTMSQLQNPDREEEEEENPRVERRRERARQRKREEKRQRVAAAAAKLTLLRPAAAAAPNPQQQEDVDQVDGEPVPSQPMRVGSVRFEVRDVSSSNPSSSSPTSVSREEPSSTEHSEERREDDGNVMDGDDEQRQRDSFASGGRRKSAVMTQSHFSLSLATKRTRSIYLQRLASKLEEMSDEEEEDGQQPEDHHEQQQQRQQQQALTGVFAQMSRLREQWSEQHGGIEMPPEMARKKLMELFEEEQRRKEESVVAGNLHQAAAAAAVDANDSTAMDDAAPPSSGFESGHVQRPRMASAAGTGGGGRRNMSSAATSASSSRGFFMSGRQKHDVVAQLHQHQQQRQQSGEGAKPSSSPPQQHQQQQQQQQKDASGGDGGGGAEAFDKSRFKYNHESEVQRAVHRSWEFRDRLNLRHSTRAYQPKVRRTITVDSNPDPKTLMQDCVTGKHLHIVL